MTTKKIDVIKAWKDPNYRNSLSVEELASLPENPVGTALDEADMATLTGGKPPVSAATSCTSGWLCTVSGETGGGCCNPFTSH